MKTEYHIFWENVTTFAIDRDERIATDSERTETVDVFDTAEAAIACAMAEARADSIQAGAYKYGAGYISRNVYYVEKFAWDNDEVFIEDEPTVATIDVLNLHPRVSAAWEHVKHDYGSEYYSPLLIELEREFGGDWEGIIRRNEDLED